MSKIEAEIDRQEQALKKILANKQQQADQEIKDADHLLKNVKGSFRV
mgnify:CR=1 FL=1